MDEDEKRVLVVSQNGKWYVRAVETAIDTWDAESGSSTMTYACDMAIANDVEHIRDAVQVAIEWLKESC